MRQSYIDVAKGLLILFVVWGHFELMCRVCFDLKDPCIDILYKVEYLWLPFFMPAFFFLSGYCTNFSKPFNRFALQRATTILIPAIVINYTQDLIDYISWGSSYLWIIKTIIKSFLTSCAHEWFLPSMFLSLLIVWMFSRLKRIVISLPISLILMVFGVYVYNHSIIPDVWYWQHALMVIPFVYLGVIYKKTNTNIYGYHYIVTYTLLMGILLFMGIPIPYITNRVYVPFMQIPLVLTLGILGTMTIISISKAIKINNILEYLGRNSLVIYLMHFIFYRIYLWMTLSLFNQSMLQSLIVYVFVFILNVVSCCFVARILNTKYLCFSLGKFEAFSRRIESV